MNYTTSTIAREHARTCTRHTTSGSEWHTDLPTAFGGLGYMPHPTEILAAAAASCMLSTMSFIAARKNTNAAGMKIEAGSDSCDGRLSRLGFRFTMPPSVQLLRPLLEDATQRCTILRALSPSIAIEDTWIWE